MRNIQMCRLGCFLFGILFASFVCANDGFVLNGKPINPVCVWLVATQYSAAGYSVKNNEPPLAYFKQPESKNMLYAINLTVCQQSHTAGYVDKNKLGYWVYHFPWGNKNNFNNSLKRGSFAYQYVGQTKSGIDVLQTIDSGGGTGQFSALLLVKRQSLTQYEKDNNSSFTAFPFISLSLVGYITGGDRATGSFKTAKVVGNTITGIRYNPKNSPNNPSYPNLKYTIQVPG